MLQDVIARGDDGVAAPLDGEEMIGGFGPADFLERLVQQRAGLIQLDAKHRERAAMHIPLLAHP